MALKTEDLQRVRVQITQAELNTLLIQPAKNAGYINFEPTRIHTRPVDGGMFEITFERLEEPTP